MTVPTPDRQFGNSIDAVRQIDGVCDAFEQAWIQGRRPRVEDYVANLSGKLRFALLRELLLLEFELRKRNGDSVSIDEYIARFPELPAEVGELLRVSKSIPLKSEGKSASQRKDQVILDHSSVELGTQLPSQLKYFGDYKLLEQIARGGMGIVYKALQVSLNRLVAIKMILAGQLASDEQVRRFYSEAESAAQLDHPNIVNVFEVGEQDGHHYFSMALVEGRSLAEKLNEGPSEPRVAAELIRQVAVAIEYAHGKGVIHRDLKPSNILIDQRGTPRITDFGLAKRAADVAGLTVTGDVLGTPSYMPPEQAAGNVNLVGPASDVYSLGAVLYALLSGRPPHQAASSVETMRQVVEQDPVRLRQLNNTIPRDLETITQKCLEKSISRRYLSAAAFANDLDNFLQGRPIQARPIGSAERAWRWCRRNRTIASLSGLTALMLIIIAAVSTVAYVRESALSTALMRRGIDLTNAFQRQKELTAAESSAKNEAVAARKMEALATTREREQRAVAAARSRLLARTAYNSDMNRIETLVRDGNYRPIERMLLRHIPETSEDEDLRSFEWHYWWNQIHQEQQTVPLPGSPERIALSPDGQFLAIGCSGGLAYVWETNPLRKLGFKLQIDDQHWSGLQFLADSKSLGGVGWKGAYRIWDVTKPAIVAQGEQVPQGKDSHGRYLATRWPAAFSSDGNWLVRANSGHIGGLFHRNTEEHLPLAEAFSGVYVRPSDPNGAPDHDMISFTCRVSTSSDGVSVGVLVPNSGRQPVRSTLGSVDYSKSVPVHRGGAPSFGSAFSNDGRLICLGHRTGRARSISRPTENLSKCWRAIVTLSGPRIFRAMANVWSLEAKMEPLRFGMFVLATKSARLTATAAQSGPRGSSATKAPLPLAKMGRSEFGLVIPAPLPFCADIHQRSSISQSVSMARRSTPSATIRR